MTTVVLAPDSFKGSISARDACAALAAGYRDVDPEAEIIARPMADGGEGTLDAFAAAVPGARRMPVSVTGPDDRVHDAAWLLLPAATDVPGGTAVVELAATSGIELLGERRPAWNAHTAGFGQAIAAAIDRGVARLILGIGSSASTDGGSGMLRALGARFVDAEGRALAPGARGLAGIVTADLSRLRALPDGGAVVLSDVTNPLLGPHGAAVVFGPQKGFAAGDIAAADAALTRFARVLRAAMPDADPDAPGAGAAGGTGFALQSWGALSVPGASAIADLIGLRGALAGADLVVTGEGSFDGQSSAGKAPAHVAELARSAGVPVALVAGRVAPDADTRAFTASISLTDLAGGAEPAQSAPAHWLRAAGTALARRCATRP
ncbi:glycerate kinase [Microbacterium kribbense]|uniref:Glycerate kinase n=1 Tax=Microbacterium kribbense TaxID=433645 RepID=A0ABP7GDR3_9MICO